MTPPEKGYENGVHDTMIKNLISTVGRIEGKLDANLEWQRGVDSRLAEGVVKFQHLEKGCDVNASEISKLRDRDRNISVLSALGSIIAGIIGVSK
jgi:hypothetical protein